MVHQARTSSFSTPLGKLLLPVTALTSLLEYTSYRLPYPAILIGKGQATHPLKYRKHWDECRKIARKCKGSVSETMRVKIAQYFSQVAYSFFSFFMLSIGCKDVNVDK